MTREPRRLGLSTLTSLGFGALMVGALAVALWVGVGSAARNTQALLRTTASLGLQLIVESLEGRVRPVEKTLLDLREMIESGAIDPRDGETFHRLALGAIAASPNLTGGLVFLTPEGRLLQVSGVTGELQTEDARARAHEGAVLHGMTRRAGAGVAWQPPQWRAGYEFTLLTAATQIAAGPVRGGMLLSGGPLAGLSGELAGVASRLGGQAFVLDGARRVIAGSNVEAVAEAYRAKTSQANPLPSLADVGDPVLAGFGADGRESLWAVGGGTADGLRGHVVEAAGEDFVYIYREAEILPGQNWLVGLSFPLSQVDETYNRLRWAVGVAVAFSAVFIAAAFWFAIRVSRPVEALVDAATRLRLLDKENMPRLPRSRVREFDDAARAISAMAEALGWFQAYVPKSLVSIFMNADALASREEELTVMFTDIVGFTAFSENRDAGETAAFLNDHFALINRAIEANGGTIDKYLGDSVMAFWGAPEAQADHARRGLRCALDIRAALEAENAARRGRGEAPVRIRVGLHAGRAVVGNIGAGGRVNYTIVGDTVNVASRIEQLPKRLGTIDNDADVVILASESVIRAAPDMAEAREVGEITLSGREAGTRIYEL